jgi:hypothetical protein
MLRALIRALAAPIRRWCTGVAVLSCVLMALLPARDVLPEFCGQLSRVPLTDLRAALGPVSLLGLLGAWALMLAAMMPPLFADPLRHVWYASLVPRRAWAGLMCLAGYAFVWISLAPIIVGLAWFLQALLPSVGAIAVALAAATVWSCSPAAQHARNWCHRRLPVGASGRRADGECFAQGLMSGAACTAVCWPWMLVPLLLGGAWHILAMVIVAIWLTLERTFPWRQPKWQLPPAVGWLLWNRTVRLARCPATRRIDFKTSEAASLAIAGTRRMLPPRERQMQSAAANPSPPRRLRSG